MAKNKDNQSPEELNEQFLKETAITFSLEGLSKDLKNFLNKKVYFTVNSLKCVSEIIESITSCDNKEVKRTLLKEDSITQQMYQHVFDEMKVTNLALNFVVQRIMEKERSLANSREENNE